MAGIQKLRFMEASGERYMADGITIRCQGRSKGKLGEVRRAFELECLNNEIAPEELADLLTEFDKDQTRGWPETQCQNAAEPGTYGCKFHGGLSPTIQKELGIAAAMPLDLRERYLRLQENPNYMDRHSDINQLEARNEQLYDEMRIIGSGADAWECVIDGLHLISEGEIKRGQALIAEGIQNSRTIRSTYNEIRANMKQMESLTRTQLLTAKEMRQMVMQEQVTAMLERIFDRFVRGVEKYVKDQDLARKLTLYFAAELRELADTISFGTIREVGGDSE